MTANGPVCAEVDGTCRIGCSATSTSARVRLLRGEVLSGAVYLSVAAGVGRCGRTQTSEHAPEVLNLGAAGGAVARSLAGSARRGQVLQIAPGRHTRH